MQINYANTEDRLACRSTEQFTLRGLNRPGRFSTILFKEDLFVLRSYGPVNPMGLYREGLVYLTNHLLDRLSPLSG